MRLLGRTSATMDPWHRRIDAKLRSRPLRRLPEGLQDDPFKLDPGGPAAIKVGVSPQQAALPRLAKTNFILYPTLITEIGLPTTTQAQA